MRLGQYEYFPIERVVFGEAFAKAIAREVERLGASRVFVVSSRQLSRTTSAIQELRTELGDRLVGLFDEGAPHTPRAVVLAGLAAARRCRPDILVSLGGGSAIDLAKMIQIGLAENIQDHVGFDPFHLRRDESGAMRTPAIRSSGLRQIAVPTTLSGAEFTHTAGSLDERAAKKDLYVLRELAPISVILDPALSLHTPEWLWLSTAVRSVDHAVESLCSLTAQPITDANCSAGLTLLQRSLRRTRRDPADLAARLDSQIGVWLSTAGLARGQHGASHGIGYAVGAVGGVPHGHCSCVLLPAVLRYNQPVNAEQQRQVSLALDAPGEDASAALLALLRELGVPTSLRDVGIRRDQFARIAETVLENGYVRTNPRPIENAAGIIEVLDIAW
jgi:alcohol dehydrogenase class IV